MGRSPRGVRFLAALVTCAATIVLPRGLRAQVGIVHPHLDPERPLYFYPAPGPGDHPSVVAPMDSVTFQAGAHHVGIATAPPWFAPEGVKLDYDLLWLKAETLTRDYIEVEVNSLEPRPRFTPRTAWIAREAVRFRPWAELLLDVHSVEILDPVAHPLRSNPSAEASAEGDAAGIPLRPLAIQGEWMQVEEAEGRESGLLRGWIRWWQDGRLLVSFSFLS